MLPCTDLPTFDSLRVWLTGRLDEVTVVDATVSSVVHGRCSFAGSVSSLVLTDGTGLDMTADCYRDRNGCPFIEIGARLRLQGIGRADRVRYPCVFAHHC